MADTNHSISTTVSFDTSQAKAKVNELEKAVDRLEGKADHVSLGGGGSNAGGAAGIAGGIGSAMSGMYGGIESFVSTTAMGLSKAFGVVGMIGSALWSAASTFVSAVWDGLKYAGHLAMTLGKTLLVGAGAFAAAIAGGIYAAHKLLSPAAEFERYQAQLSVFGKSDKIGEYQKVAMEGPQDLGQVVRAGISLESYGLDSSKYLKTVQDAASTFGRDMSEVAGILSRAKSGTIEIDQMNMVGLTKADLMAQGVKYDNGGGIADESKAGLEDKVAAAMDAKYKGMSITMSKTYEGAISNLMDNLKTGIANTFASLLPYATALVNGVSESIKTIGDGMSKINWKGVEEQLISLWDKAAAIIGSINWTELGNTFTIISEKVLAVASMLLSAEGWTAIGATLLGVLDSAWIGLKLVVAESLTWLGNALNAAFLWITNPTLWKNILYYGFIGALGVLAEIGRAILGTLYTLFTGFYSSLKTIFDFALAGWELIISKIPGVGGLVGTMYREQVGMTKDGKGGRSFSDQILYNQDQVDSLGINPWTWEEPLSKMAGGMLKSIMPTGDGNGVGAALEKTLGDIMRKANELVNKAVLDGKKPEATAAIEAEKRRQEAAEAARKEQIATAKRLAEQQKQADDLAEAQRAANSIQSQILQEMRTLNDYNQTDLAAAFF